MIWSDAAGSASWSSWRGSKALGAFDADQMQRGASWSTGGDPSHLQQLMPWCPVACVDAIM